MYVCAADIYNEKYNMGFNKDTSPNCSECDKCKRTLITLDLLGELDNFSGRFDLYKYQKYKDLLFINVIVNHKSNHFLQEIYDLMIETDPHILKKYKTEVIVYKLKRIVCKLKNRIAQIKTIRKIYRFIFKNKKNKQ